MRTISLSDFTREPPLVDGKIYLVVWTAGDDWHCGEAWVLQGENKMFFTNCNGLHFYKDEVVGWIAME